MMRHTFLLQAPKRMDFPAEPSNNAASPPIAYVTAPTSPNGCSSSSSTTVLRHSAPTSPRPSNTVVGDGSCFTNEGGMRPNHDEFEFETSKKFSGRLRLEPGSEGRQKFRVPGDSPPTMAFADELFVNGRVMPLKLPPRLQGEAEFNRNPVSLQKTPRAASRMPFTRKGSWHGEFDPFMVALEKVREDNRGRNSHHGRSRSYSPYGTMPKYDDLDSSGYSNQELTKGESSIELDQIPASGHSGSIDFKGSAYARWVRGQTREGRIPKSTVGSILGERAGSVAIEHGPDKTTSPKGKYVKNKNEETKVQKLKGFLLRYAPFGKDNNGNKQTKDSSEERKPGYFSRMRFRFKRMPADTDRAAIEYNPSCEG